MDTYNVAQMSFDEYRKVIYDTLNRRLSDPEHHYMLKCWILDKHPYQCIRMLRTGAFIEEK